MDQTAKRFPNWFMWFVYLGLPLCGAGTDIYTPSLPTISRFFHASETLTQFTVTAYLISFAISQLIAGPLSDRYGRKKLMVIGLFIFSLASLSVIYDTTITSMLVSRLIQGLAIGIFTVPIRSIIADLYTGKMYKRKVNYMIFSWGLGPIIAPWVGAHLHTWYNWQANFIFLATYSGLLFFAVLFLYRNTHTPTFTEKTESFFAGYRKPLSSSFFISCGIVGAILYGFFIIYNIETPFLIQNLMGKTVIQFSHTVLILGVSWALGSLTNRFTESVPLKTKLSYAFGAIFFVILVMIYLTRSNPISLWHLALPCGLITYLSSICFASITGRALVEYTENTGAANAALFSMMWFFIGLLSYICAMFQIGSSVRLGLFYICIIVVVTIIYRLFIVKSLDYDD